MFLVLLGSVLSALSMRKVTAASPSAKGLRGNPKQQGSPRESEIIPGFGIPLQHIKPYPSRGCVRKTNSFIYCHTSAMAFIKLKAESFSIFYLPESSKSSVWSNFPTFSQSCQQKAKAVSPVTPEVPVQGLLPAQGLFNYSSEINGGWIPVVWCETVSPDVHSAAATSLQGWM